MIRIGNMICSAHPVPAAGTSPPREALPGLLTAQIGVAYLVYLYSNIYSLA